MNSSQMGPSLSSFACGLTAETAFDVLAIARKLKGAGKDEDEVKVADISMHLLEALERAPDPGTREQTPVAD